MRPDTADRPPSIELRSGPLRSTALTAGWDHPEDRPLVVCLHGFPDSPSTFRHQLPALAAAGYRVLAPTLRGYEPSSQPTDDDYSIATLAHDVVAWLDHLGEERAHLVGHDWGAAITYVAGAQAPERFASLTTVAVPHPARFAPAILAVPRQLLHSWYMLFFQIPRIPELVLPRDDWALVRRLWKTWSPGYTLNEDEWSKLRETFEAPGVLESMLEYYRRNAAPRALVDPAVIATTRPVRVPTLAITGADDGCIDTTLFDHAMAREDFTEELRVERMEGAGHFAHLERPRAFNNLLLEWLERH